jgi:diguanylate cyclase (GGDEF)-like protein
MLVVADTRADPAWAENPQVTGAPGLRSYAGAAIVSDEGHALGSVCVADTRGPCQLSGKQLKALRMLARQAASHLSLRRRTAELARVTAQLQERAIRDGLTGLPNRAFFEEALGLSLRQRGSGRPGLLLCDLNGFKQINDRLGHHAGDELLRLTGQRIKRVARVSDLVARLAGDEFVVLCPGIERDGDLHAVADRVTEAVAEPATIAATEIVPGMTVGAAVAREGDDVADVMQRADEAMYAAKPGAVKARRAAGAAQMAH